MSTIKYIIVIISVFTVINTAAKPTAITNVNVIAMDAERIDAAQTVVVDRGRIVAMSSAAEATVPKNAVHIDGAGHYLIPGLAEMHAHIPDPDDSPEFTERVLTLFIVNGITTIRGMLGHPSHLALREKTASGSVLGPRIITSGPSFSGNSVDNPDQAVSLVKAQHADGYDFIKLHPGLNLAEFDAIAATANKFGMPFAGHVSLAVGLPRTLEAKQATIDHLDGYMQALVREDTIMNNEAQEFFGLALASSVAMGKLTKVAKETAAADVWNVPTESFIENMVSSIPAKTLQDWPEMRYMPVSMVDEWVKQKQALISGDRYDPALAKKAIHIRRQLIKALHDAGAGLLLGSDSPQVFNVPGYAAHRELEILVEAGLTPYEALQTGTVNPARFFGAADEYGSIEVGRAADLVLLRANPLADIRNTSQIAGVMRRGQWLSREQLDQLLEKYDSRK